MLNTLIRLHVSRTQRERGATAVEYGIMVALIAAVIVGLVAILGDQIEAAFQTVIDELPGGEGLRRR